MNMFCFQCQETARGEGCTVRGVCGKTVRCSQSTGFVDLCYEGYCRLC